MAEATESAAPPSSRDAIRASVLAEIESLKEEPVKALAEGDEQAEKPAEPAPDADADTDPEVKPAEEEETDDEPDDDEEPEDKPEPAAAAKADPDQEKRLQAVHREVKRGKEAVAKEREAFERQREAFQREWGPRVQAAESFEQLKARAARDPAGVLEALGVTDFDYAARQNYLRSKAAAADPKAREAADRMMREREHQDALATTQRELADLKREMSEQRTQRQVAAWIDTVAKQASDETPLVKTMISKSPEKARGLLSQVAQLLIEETGETPDPADVVKALEDHERAELEARGIDYSAIKANPKKTTPAEAKRPGKTLSNDIGSPATPRTAPKSRQDERDEVMRALEDGRLEF